MRLNQSGLTKLLKTSCQKHCSKSLKFLKHTLLQNNNKYKLLYRFHHLRTRKSHSTFVNAKLWWRALMYTHRNNTSASWYPMGWTGIFGIPTPSFTLYRKVYSKKPEQNIHCTAFLSAFTKLDRDFFWSMQPNITYKHTSIPKSFLTSFIRYCF